MSDRVSQPVPVPAINTSFASGGSDLPPGPTRRFSRDINPNNSAFYSPVSTERTVNTALTPHELSTTRTNLSFADIESEVPLPHTRTAEIPGRYGGRGREKQPISRQMFEVEEDESMELPRTFTDQFLHFTSTHSGSVKDSTMASEEGSLPSSHQPALPRPRVANRGEITDVSDTQYIDIGQSDMRRMTALEFAEHQRRARGCVVLRNQRIRLQRTRRPRDAGEQLTMAGNFERSTRAMRWPVLTPWNVIASNCQGLILRIVEPATLRGHVFEMIRPNQHMYSVVIGRGLQTGIEGGRLNFNTNSISDTHARLTFVRTETRQEVTVEDMLSGEGTYVMRRLPVKLQHRPILEREVHNAYSLDYVDFLRLGNQLVLAIEPTDLIWDEAAPQPMSPGLRVADPQPQQTEPGGPQAGEAATPAPTTPPTPPTPGRKKGVSFLNSTPPQHTRSPETTQMLSNRPVRKLLVEWLALGWYIPVVEDAWERAFAQRYSKSTAFKPSTGSFLSNAPTIASEREDRSKATQCLWSLSCQFPNILVIACLQIIGGFVLWDRHCDHPLQEILISSGGVYLLFVMGLLMEFVTRANNNISKGFAARDKCRIGFFFIISAVIFGITIAGLILGADVARDRDNCDETLLVATTLLLVVPVMVLSVILLSMLSWLLAQARQEERDLLVQLEEQALKDRMRQQQDRNQRRSHPVRAADSPTGTVSPVLRSSKSSASPISPIRNRTEPLPGEMSLPPIVSPPQLDINRLEDEDEDEDEGGPSSTPPALASYPSHSSTSPQALHHFPTLSSDGPAPQATMLRQDTNDIMMMQEPGPMLQRSHNVPLETEEVDGVAAVRGSGGGGIRIDEEEVGEEEEEEEEDGTSRDESVEQLDLDADADALALDAALRDVLNEAEQQ